MEFLLTIGIGINFFTLLQLIRGKSWGVFSNSIAIAIVSLWLLRFLLMYLKLQEFILAYPFLLVFDQYLFLLDGVLLWLYAKSLLVKISFHLRTFLHFVPFLIGMFLYSTQVLFVPKEEILKFYLQVIEAFTNNTLIVIIEDFLFIVIILTLSTVYFLKSLQEIRRYNQVLFANFSNLKDLNASWLITFLRLWMLLFLIPILIYFLNYINPIMDMTLIGYFMLAFLLLFSFLFNANVINQHYLPTTLQKKSFQKENTILPKTVEIQFQKVTDILKNEKYYEDENLSLQKLSDHLEMKPVDLTELIKSSTYNNFYDLINSYRIEAIKKELITTKEQVMIIAYNNGFNSKSAFNRIFKESTGQTPSQYRKSQK